jgi:hypothetical protein
MDLCTILTPKYINILLFGLCNSTSPLSSTCELILILFQKFRTIILSQCIKLGSTPKFFKSLTTLHYVKKFTLIPCNKPFGVHHLSYLKHFLIYLNASRVLIIHYENIFKIYLVYSKIYFKYTQNILFFHEKLKNECIHVIINKKAPKTNKILERSGFLGAGGH